MARIGDNSSWVGKRKARKQIGEARRGIGICLPSWINSQARFIPYLFHQVMTEESQKRVKQAEESAARQVAFEEWLNSASQAEISAYLDQMHTLASPPWWPVDRASGELSVAVTDGPSHPRAEESP